MKILREEITEVTIIEEGGIITKEGDIEEIQIEEVISWAQRTGTCQGY